MGQPAAAGGSIRRPCSERRSVRGRRKGALTSQCAYLCAAITTRFPLRVLDPIRISYSGAGPSPPANICVVQKVLCPSNCWHLHERASPFRRECYSRKPAFGFSITATGTKAGPGGPPRCTAGPGSIPPSMPLPCVANLWRWPSWPRDSDAALSPFLCEPRQAMPHEYAGLGPAHRGSDAGLDR